MERFQLRPDETVLKKGSLKHYQGAIGFSDIMTGKTKVVSCHGILTSRRFVATKRTSMAPPFGPLIWLIARLVNRGKIVFEIPLGDLTAIRLKNGTKLIRLATVGGGEFPFVSDGFTDQTESWVEAISEAAAAALPDRKVNRTPEAVEFARA
jgi:hypothetical protein